MLYKGMQSLKVSTASAYCREHRHAWHGWFQRWLNVEGISVNADKTRKESVSEGIIKKVKGDDAERQLAKQRQRMTNHRAHKTGRQRYQQVISIYWLPSFIKIFVFSRQTWNCRLLASHIIHVLPKCVPHYMHMHVLLHN